MKNRIGKKILGPNNEQFIIEKKIGKGGFGEVYRAIGETSKLTVALKMIPSSKISSPETLSFRGLLNEIKHALLEIRHPNVVSYLYVDEGTDEKIGPYLMLEYVEGGTVLDLLNENRPKNELVPLEMAISLMRQIALGSEAINEKVIHRDIKPDNILLAGQLESLTPKIADFGISKFTLEETRLETFKGIQHFYYISPEVIRRETNTYKIDVYSVGLVFYEILSLQHPLLMQLSNPDDVFEWQEAHLNLLPPDIRTLRSDVPLQIAKILLQMTAKFPSERPEWTEILAAINFEQPKLKPIVEIDPSLISIMERHVEEELRKDQEEKLARLKADRKAEEKRLFNKEVRIYQNNLLDQLDAVIEQLNIPVLDYKIEINRDFEMGRSYRFPSGRSIQCSLMSVDIEMVRGDRAANIQAVGFLGCHGGLSMNVVFFGQRNNLPEAQWQGIGCTVSGIIGGISREQAYKEAGADNATIRFAEFLDGNAAWRRDLPGYFGFTRLNSFVNHFSTSSGMLFNFQYIELLPTFNQIIRVAMQMPKISS